MEKYTVTLEIQAIVFTGSHQQCNNYFEQLGRQNRDVLYNTEDGKNIVVGVIKSVKLERSNIGYRTND